MSLFLSVVAFLLSVSAIIIGAAALRRIDGQNEEFLKAYVQEIRNDLLAKDQQIAALRRDLAAVRSNRTVSREALRTLEQEAARKRRLIDKAAAESESGLFLPSIGAPKKRKTA